MLIFKGLQKSRQLSGGRVREDIGNETFVAFHLEDTSSTWDQIRRNWSYASL